jgi:hypothetical protein
MKLFAVIGTITGIVTVILSALSGLLIFKLVRYLDTAQRALPKMEKAAQLYVEKNSGEQNQTIE